MLIWTSNQHFIFSLKNKSNTRKHEYYIETLPVYCPDKKDTATAKDKGQKIDHCTAALQDRD